MKYIFGILFACVLLSGCGSDDGEADKSSCADSSASECQSSQMNEHKAAKEIRSESNITSSKPKSWSYD
ncbi:hypothetical protein R84865_002140 [Carnimonas sp. R-84865]